MNTSRFILSIIFFLFALQIGNAQKAFHIEIQFPDSTISKNASIDYDNGRSTANNITLLPNGHLTLSDTFYAKKAVIYIHLKDDKYDFTDGYFVNESPARFIYEGIDSSNRKPIFKTVNATAISQSGEKQLKEFTAKEEADASIFFRENGSKLSKGDSIASIESNKKILAITNKRLEFINRNSDLYYSFWFFRKNIIGNLLLEPDSLLSFYRTTFPIDFRQSDEGNQITTFLNGRLISSSRKSIAPDFITKDIHGKRISLKDFKGKYVLLSFWATWCLPCVEELPAMQKIRKSTATKKFEIISVSFDNDIKALNRGIKTHEMNWVNVYFDENISKAYGVSSLPMLFLIDDKGKVVYSRKTDEKEYKSLSVLSKLIKEAKLN